MKKTKHSAKRSATNPKQIERTEQGAQKASEKAPKKKTLGYKMKMKNNQRRPFFLWRKIE